MNRIILFSSLIIFLLLPTACSHSKKNTGAVAPNTATSDWKNIWLEKDDLAALKKFSAQNGLFIETGLKMKNSYLINEDGCGERYMTLVKDTQTAAEVVWELDKKGKIVNTWHPGTNELADLDGKSTLGRNRIYKIDGTKLYREISYYEDPQDFDNFPPKPQPGTPPAPRKRSPSHLYHLVIDANGSFDVHERDEGFSNADSFKKINCPPLPKAIKSAFAYCIKNVKNKKTYVLQEVCT